MNKHVLVNVGFKAQVADLALNAKLNWAAVLALAAKYGIPLAEEIVTELASTGKLNYSTLITKYGLPMAMEIITILTTTH